MKMIEGVIGLEWSRCKNQSIVQAFYQTTSNDIYLSTVQLLRFNMADFHCCCNIDCIIIYYMYNQCNISVITYLR